MKIYVENAHVKQFFPGKSFFSDLCGFSLEKRDFFFIYFHIEFDIIGCVEKQSIRI
jgi:hypothetical protein